jgi:hypothetical protein
MSSIICFIVWVGCGVLLTRVAVDRLWEYPRSTEWLVFIVSMIVGVGGLVCFWQILDQLKFWDAAIVS